MKVVEVRTGHVILVEIIPAELSDLKNENFHFDWMKEVNHQEKYKMKQQGRLLSLEVPEILEVINMYDYDK
jgi:hypothetical protein